MIYTFQKNKQEINKKIRRWKLNKFLQNNYGWIIAFLSLLGIVASNIFKFIEYLNNEIKFSYYGLDHNLYNYSDKNFVYNLCCSLIFLIAFGFLLYCFKQIGSNIKKQKIICKNNATDIFIIIVSNVYLVLIYCPKLSYKNMLINFIIFIFLEAISAYIIFRDTNKNNLVSNDKKEIIVDNIKTVVFLVIFLIISNSIRICLNLSLLTQYKTINNDKVIVYSTNDYYLTLDCDINGKELIIYKGKQEKIDNNNVKSELKNFDKVIMK